MRDWLPGQENWTYHRGNQLLLPAVEGARATSHRLPTRPYHSGGEHEERLLLGVATATALIGAASGTGPVAPSAQAATTEYVSTTYTAPKKGQTDAGVKALQHRLVKAKNLDSALVTSYFGDLTEAGVKKFQRGRDLTDNGKVSSTFDARFGCAATRTREGQFSVLWKSRNHVSTIYHTPMPYAMFFSGGQAVHYSADFARRGYNGCSHGCVNIRDKAGIAWVFDQVRNGDRVVVYRS